MRLESLGFRDIYDYVAGKADWLANGLPIAGERAGQPRAGDLARRDIPTCRLDERAADVLPRLDQAGWDTCVVVDAQRTVLGLLSRDHLERQPDAEAGEVMEEGPTTTRLDASPDDLRERMDGSDAGHILVTTNFGNLAGVVWREDLDHAGQ